MEEIAAELAPRLAELKAFGIDPGKAEISWKTVDEEDWAHAWKQYFKPLRVSNRLTIKPVWEEYTPASAEEKIIEIDPGMAFGTGTHPTTALCLRALEKHVAPGDEVIDVGTGSGILAAGAVLLGAKSVLALDLDPVAVASARQNVVLNRLETAVTVKESDLLSLLGGEGAADTAAGEMWPSARPGQPAEPDAVPSADGLGVSLPVRIVVANILAEIIVLFTDDVYRALQPGGSISPPGFTRIRKSLSLRRSNLPVSRF